jgi:hypothetical protein
LKEEAKPFRQKLRQINPMLLAYYGKGGKEVIGCPNNFPFEIFRVGSQPGPSKKK